MATDITCVICFEPYTEETRILFSCSHHICLVCYEKLINRHDTIHCPLCRAVVDEQHVSIKEEEPTDSESTESTEFVTRWEQCQDCFVQYGGQVICCATLFGLVVAFLATHK